MTANSMSMRTVLYLNAVGGISGAERSLLAMVEALDRERWRPVAAAPDGPLLAELAARGVETHAVALAPVHRPHTMTEGWALLQAMRHGWRAVNDLVEAVQPHLLHANTASAMLYALRAELPRVWHARDVAPLGKIGGLLYRTAAAVAVISETVFENVLAYATDDGAKLMLVPPSVDTARFHPAEDKAALRRDLGLPADVPLIGLLAQFVPWKRHGLFLDALECLLDRPWHAVLVGAEWPAPPSPSGGKGPGDRGDDYAAGLRARLAAPPLAGRATWLPWQDDAAPLIAALDLLALTSEREPFGRVLIEALACGVPVVAVNEGGPAELVQHDVTGLLAPADAAGLADAMAALLDNPARAATLAAAGRADVEANFSLRRQRVALTELYASAIAV